MTIAEQILQLVQNQFQDKNLTYTSKLEAAAGYDSVQHVQFIIELETVFEVDLADDTILRSSTIDDVIQTIAAKKG